MKVLFSMLMSASLLCMSFYGCAGELTSQDRQKLQGWLDQYYNDMQPESQETVKDVMQKFIVYCSCMLNTFNVKINPVIGIPCVKELHTLVESLRKAQYDASVDKAFAELDPIYESQKYDNAEQELYDAQKENDRDKVEACIENIAKLTLDRSITVNEYLMSKIS